MTTPRFYNCYQDQDPGLSPKSTRLVFQAVIFHGMGHQENQWFEVGTDEKNEWCVLWQRTDWDDGTSIPVAWIARGTLRGRALWTGLVHAWFTGAKAAQDATEPPYDEFTPTKHGLLDEETVQAIAEQVWPEETDEDFAE